MKFQKAYFFTLAMFLGEAGCLAMYYVKKWMERRRAAQPNNHYQSLGAGLLFEDGPLNQMTPHLPAVSSLSVVPPVEESAPKKPPIWVYLVLCLFDLSATAVGGVGFMWVDASTNQMLRGSMTIFCAIFSVLLLRRRLNWKQWSSLGLVVFGLALVGMAGMLKKKHDESQGSTEDDDVTSGQLLLGIVLVLFGSSLNAIQNVYEEKLLKDLGGAEVDPLELVGWEGVFGSLLSAFVMLPIVHYIPGDECGRTEDSIHTLQQLSHSPMVVLLVLSYSISLMFMNWSSQQISQQLSSVHRNLVSSVRIVLVWVFSLWMFYATRGNEQVYGEEWSNWSLIKLGGFLVLMSGTVL
jgi:drug/metabolite transporter (DMT)-like permease